MSNPTPFRFRGGLLAFFAVGCAAPAFVFFKLPAWTARRGARVTVRGLL